MPRDILLITVEALKKLTRQRENLKDLTREEACELFGSILEGKLSPIRAAFFLSAMRIKGETTQELLGVLEAIRKRASLPKERADVDLALPYDGKTKTLFILPSALWLLREAGIKFSAHHGGRIPVKEGVTLSEVLGKLGEDLPVLRAHQRDLVPSLFALVPLRKELGFRTLINVVEKLLNPFRSRFVIVSVFHSPYLEKYSLLCEALGFEDYAVVQGLEGGAEPPPDRPLKVLRRGEEVMEINPEELGLKLPSSVKTQDPLGDSLYLTRSIIKGRERGEFLNWALYTASLLLFLTRRVGSVREGLELLRDTTKL